MPLRRGRSAVGLRLGRGGRAIGIGLGLRRRAGLRRGVHRAIRLGGLCIALLSTVCVAVGGKGDVPAAAAKEETVYVFTDASGSVKNILVSDWLTNPDGSDSMPTLSGNNFVAHIGDLFGIVSPTEDIEKRKFGPAIPDYLGDKSTNDTFWIEE